MIQLSNLVGKDLPSYKKLRDNSKLTTSQIKQWVNINSNKYIISYGIGSYPLQQKMPKVKGKDIVNYIKGEEEKLFLS